jgi:signal transduction histidine kinase
MRPLATLRNRVFLASALVAVLSMAFAARFVSARAAREAEAELRRGLEGSAALVEQHHAARLETLLTMARLVADLPKLKAAVETGDPPTVLPIAEDYRSRVRADLLLVADESGRRLAGLGPGAEAAFEPAALEAALQGRETTGFRARASGLVETVTVPIAIGPDPPEVLGVLGLGFTLDDARAAEFKGVTDSDVAIGMGDRVLASTLRSADRGALARAVQSADVTSLTLEGDEWVALRRELRVPGGVETPFALVLRSRTEHLRFLRTVQQGLFAGALVAVLVAVLLSYGVARSVTRPLAALSADMREMATTGDLRREVRPPGRWDDEDARLLTSTFRHLAGSLARIQREAAQRERLQALGRLSTVIAHEVRNPLMIIKSALRELRREGATREDLGEAAADIDHEVGRLNRIVEDVLDFARPIRVDYAPTDVNAVCRDAAQAALGEQVAVRLRLDPALGLVSTDGERLRTVLLNVLTNARDGVLAAGEKPPAGVELRTESAGARVLIAVRDHGVGIEPEQLAHVFEPYFTTKRTGTGLGLAIAKNVVEALGGTITLTSAPGAGTEVRLELPRTPPAAAA